MLEQNQILFKLCFQKSLLFNVEMPFILLSVLHLLPIRTQNMEASMLVKALVHKWGTFSELFGTVFRECRKLVLPRKDITYTTLIVVGGRLLVAGCPATK